MSCSSPGTAPPSCSTLSGDDGGFQSDSVRLAERILSDADEQAAGIKQEAWEQANAIREAAEREAEEIRRQSAYQAEALREAEREAEEIRRQAAYQAEAVREAAAREADELRAGAIRLSAELGQVAAYVTRTLTIPAIPAAEPADQPRQRGAEDFAIPVAQPRTRPATGPRTRPVPPPRRGPGSAAPRTSEARMRGQQPRHRPGPAGGHRPVRGSRSPSLASRELMPAAEPGGWGQEAPAPEAWGPPAQPGHGRQKPSLLLRPRPPARPQQDHTEGFDSPAMPACGAIDLGARGCLAAGNPGTRGRLGARSSADRPAKAAGQDDHQAAGQARRQAEAGRPDHHSAEAGRPDHHSAEAGRPDHHSAEAGRPDHHSAEAGGPGRHQDSARDPAGHYRAPPSDAARSLPGTG